ncbi:hypothetical protein V6N13_133635 [Hibiscus sabdariffa]|uniref:Uncharacterized protein n=2 Tax=Hibiscus sabdariffa TaxID=183260 RepID=A0ABR2BPQ3_9ROSI
MRAEWWSLRIETLHYRIRPGSGEGSVRSLRFVGFLPPRICPRPVLMLGIMMDEMATLLHLVEFCHYWAWQLRCVVVSWMLLAHATPWLGMPAPAPSFGVRDSLLHFTFLQL